MAKHAEITAATGTAIYFCEARASWQRGSNENANGLLRDYFLKGSNLTPSHPGHLAAVAIDLNARPRKTHDWDTPADRFAKLLASTISA